MISSYLYNGNPCLGKGLTLYSDDPLFQFLVIRFYMDTMRKMTDNISNAGNNQGELDQYHDFWWNVAIIRTAFSNEMHADID